MGSNKHLSVLPQIPKPTITIMSGNSSVGQSGVYEAGDQRNYKDSELKAAQEPYQEGKGTPTRTSTLRTSVLLPTSSLLRSATRAPLCPHNCTATSLQREPSSTLSCRPRMSSASARSRAISYDTKALSGVWASGVTCSIH